MEVTDALARTDTEQISITIETSTLPDLIVTGVTGQDAAEGGTLSFSSTIQNVGNAVAGPSTATVWLSRSDGSGSTFLCEASIGSLAAGASTPFSGTCSVPDMGIAPGGYLLRWLRIRVDADNDVSESNENNNTTLSSGFYTISGT